MAQSYNIPTLQSAAHKSIHGAAVSADKDAKQSLSRNNPLHYHKAEILWKTAIELSHKRFPEMSLPNAFTKALTGERILTPAKLGTRKRIKMAEGKRKTTSKDVEDNRRVEIDMFSAASCSKQVELGVLLIEMHGLSDVLNSRGNYLDTDGRYPFILNWPEKLVLDEQSSVLVGMHDLAKIVAARGKHVVAEELFQSLVDLMEEELEMDDPELSEAMSSLAMILTKLGRSEQAEVMYRRTLKLRNKILMWDDPKTQDTLEHLCMLLKKRGKTQQAAELTQTYRLPTMFKAIMLGLHECMDCHVSLIDDHHDDMDVQKFVETDVSMIKEMGLRSGDDSLAVELILDPEDLRMVIILSRRALMSPQDQLILAVEHGLKYGLGDWHDMGIDTYVCSIDQGEDGMLWVLPNHFDL